MTSRRSDQASLFDEPTPNSPEDLGFGPTKPERPDEIDQGPPADKSYGEPSPGPDPVPHNVASGTIQIEDARTFVSWLHEQELPCHADVTIGHVLVGLSGRTPQDLRWLCQAVRQAGNIPDPYRMGRALKERDVALLRGD